MAFFATLVVIAFVPRLVAALRANTIALACVAFGMSLVTAVFFANTSLLPGNLIGLSAVACCVVAGILSAFYFIVVGLYLACFDVRLVMQSVFAGLALSALIYCLVIALPLAGYASVAAALPLLSYMVLVQTRKLSSDVIAGRQSTFSEALSECGEHDSTAQEASGHLSRFVPRATYRSQLLRLSLCALLVGFANETNRFLYNEVAAPIIDAATFRFSQDIAALVIVLFCVACLIVLHSRNGSRFLHLLFWGIFALLFVATIALPATLLFPDAKAAYLLFTALSSASYECFSLLIWIGPALIASRDMGCGAQAFALVRVGWSGGQLFGIMTATTFAAVLAVWNLYLYSAASCIILVVSFVVCFPESALDAVLRTPVEEKSEQHSMLDPGCGTLEVRCRDLAESHGISQREFDVMLLLAEGRNTASVMDKLALSRSTVSTHRQHIYQKLGIHSQQELIELAQENSRQGRQ